MKGRKLRELRELGLDEFDQKISPTNSRSFCLRSTSRDVEVSHKSILFHGREALQFTKLLFDFSPASLGGPHGEKLHRRDRAAVATIAGLLFARGSRCPYGIGLMATLWYHVSFTLQGG